ncbi:hypothetical protein [Sulfurimonas sp.]|uniref:hypothetical protein n=1 Tax=Sulfurimonas sp. TaxID=2022749 RepID=UPI00262DFAC3|nr:hypothetical protein [Sulfurimonas sp.]
MVKKVAIFHEGKSRKSADEELLNLLIKDLQLDIERVKFFGMKSKSNFFKIDDTNYKELQHDIELENISKILFVLDADYEKNDRLYGGYSNTQREIEKIIKNLKLEDSADYFIMCDPKTKCGYLESFILASIPAKEKRCIEEFLDCSSFKSKENDKAILNQIYKIAYPTAPFGFSHENFDNLKEKLHNLFAKSDDKIKKEK